jgi:hypothetical protein
MIKLIYFLVGWVVGIVVLNKFVFEMFLKFITSENAVAILGVLLVSFYTMIWGIVCIKMAEKK